jgi:hypothetical protein
MIKKVLNMVSPHYIKIIMVMFIIVNLSCSTGNYKSLSVEPGSNNYDSAFPYRDGSRQLEEISETIYRINTIAFYRVHIFADHSNLKLSDINDEVINKLTVKNSFMNKTSSGTGTVIYSSNGTVGLLTCAHVVNFQDTLVSSFSDGKGISSDEVQSISFKTKQVIYVAGFPAGSEVKEILSDNSLDVAVLGNNFGPDYDKYFHQFNYPFGKASELNWGNFIYFFGFPLNYKMLSTAIVSSPDYDKSDSFFIDGVINNGCSGGIVLATRNGIPNFELVGIIDWVPDESENILQPAQLEDPFKYNPLVPYKGDYYVKEEKFLMYGIAKVISIESVIDFLKKNKKYFLDNGFYFSIYNE